MLSNFDLNHLLTFPVKEAGARKQFLIGTLVYLAAFIVPIIPVLFATGYMMRIMRQVLKGEQPRMVDWDEWGEMFTDGARLFGVRLVYALPIFLLLCPLMGFNFALPFILENAGNDADWIVILFPILFGGFFLVFIPFMLAFSILIPAAEVHVTDRVEFAAAFRVREWWGIFRANWVGFLLAFVIVYGISFVLTLIIQFAMITIVLICALPIIMPGVAMYLSVVTYAAFAQAYKDGRDKLQSASIVPAE
jgi:hypothetical protein